MTATASENAACPRHPLDQDAAGVNRPGLYPNEMYHRIRETGTGVAEVIRPTGTGKLVTRYDDVKEVLRNQAVFSREAALDADDVGLEDTILGLDGERHAAVRNVVKALFTPRAVERHRSDIEMRAATRLKEMTGKGEPADLIEDFALPLALDTICDLLGLPPQDRARFRQWGEAFLAHTVVAGEEAQASSAAMAGYLAGLIEQRRQRPEPDLLGRIAVAGADLPAARQIMLPIALVLGGWETTASSIGTFVQVLLTHPYEGYETAYAYLIDRPEMIPAAVTELTRMFSTTGADAMPRRVTRRVTLPSGAELQPGEIVIPSVDAGSYDPRVFPDPHRMIFDRPYNHHLSFGHGPHHCLGRHLGHLEIIVALGLLTRELPRLRLAVPSEDIPRRTGHAIKGVATLPVTWT
ncbi:cytochrome P450 [Streptosporangium pseudovulgare]|uniref:Cytochrome P450 n=1 Tax=Streptosporangium pseudovulgare TaxID=35765 RepID=A0ABQ2R032_9ACTN|nr:cytochrome P450 [Streptosporangium pseudovulgare]GGQ05584.1 cytochrome P450 [Streptosporangium pseudovulgare]